MVGDEQRGVVITEIGKGFALTSIAEGVHSQFDSAITSRAC
jgi:hypothetical protein